MQIFEFPASVHTRWFTAENPLGKPGQGGRSNRGAKGRASVSLKPGDKLVMLDTEGPGILRRIWLTVSNAADKENLRGLRIRMHWEGEKTPAVDCPLGDFFGIGLGRKAAFESVLFSDPEGRSFNCHIPMPFRHQARVELWNETRKAVTVFYDLNLTLGDSLPEPLLYFHAHWRRENPNRLGNDYTLLPKIEGRGRYLGANIGLKEDPRYTGSWFGEGEVKAYLDGDKDFPTLCGTGTEDYIGTAWGQGKFATPRSGCLIRDEGSREWCFYRYHTEDPVYFHRAIKVDIQVMGGAHWRTILAMRKLGAKLKPVTVVQGELIRPVLEKGMPKKMKGDEWVNFFRQDDVSSTAYFYLDRLSTTLQKLPSLDERRIS